MPNKEPIITSRRLAILAATSLTIAVGATQATTASAAVWSAQASSALTDPYADGSSGGGMRPYFTPDTSIEGSSGGGMRPYFTPLSR